MIEKNMQFGGDVVFLPKGELDDFQAWELSPDIDKPECR